MNRTIRMLALADDRQNKTRSFLTALTVFFTTLLLTAVFSIGWGALDFQIQNAGNLYGSYYAALSGLERADVSELSGRGEVDRIGLSLDAGIVRSETKASLALCWMDDACLSMTGVGTGLEEGAYPRREYELAAAPGFFAAAGLTGVSVGDTVTLTLRFGLDAYYEPVEFTVSGILREPSGDTAPAAYSAFVSEAFAERSSGSYTAYFTLNDSVEMDNTNYTDTMKALVSEWGFDADRLSDNGSYLRFHLDPGTEVLAGCALISAAVILFSILVIYNIFQVGAAQRIQEYGKLKAIGATKKQLRGLILSEGMLLTVLGIVPGLAAGCACAVLFLPWVTQLPGVQEEMVLQIVPVYPWVLLLAAALSLAAAALALIRPMHIVAGVSPVEAIGYREQQSSVRGKKRRRGYRTMSVLRLTLSNLSANRRRTAATILTMGLSGVLFVALSNYVGNIDVEYEARKDVRYGQFALSLDYALRDTAYPENNLDAVLGERLLGEQTLVQIRQIPGVTEVLSQVFLSGNDGEEPTSVSVLTREDFDLFAQEDGYVGETDYDAVSRENGVIYGYSYFLERYGYELGDVFSFSLTDGSQNRELSAPLLGAAVGAGTYWAITEDTWRSLNLSGDSNGIVWVDCAPENAETVGEALEALSAETPHLTLESYADALSLANSSLAMLSVLIYSALILFGVIGYLNMANTLIISLITRRREFGILQAIGMTRRQLNASLQLEGLVFTAGCALTAVLAGIPAAYGFFLYGKNNQQYGLNVFHMQWVEMLLFLLAVFALQCVLSFILSRNLKKESVMERIRYRE